MKREANALGERNFVDIGVRGGVVSRDRSITLMRILPESTDREKGSMRLDKVSPVTKRTTLKKKKRQKTKTKKKRGRAL